ncbi:MAG: DUF7309 domain-containing protein [Vagococcus sp.]
MNSVLIKEWTRLIEASIQLRHINPWEFIQEKDLLVLHLPSAMHPMVIRIKGQEFQSRSIVVFHTSMSQKLLASTLGHSVTIVDPLSYSTSKKEALVCYFKETDELSEQDVSLFTDLGYSLDERCSWPVFSSFIVGHVPNIPSKRDITLLADIYESLILVLTRPFSILPGQCLHISGTTTYTAPYDLYEHNKLKTRPFNQDIICHKLKKRTFLPLSIEMTYFYTNQLNNDGDIMVAMIAVNAHSGNVLFFDVVPSSDNLADTLLERLNQFMLENGLPMKISVRLDDLAYVLSDLCDKLGISLYVKEELYALEEASLRLIDFMQ